MADDTPRFGLNRFDDYETPWDHTDTVEALDELAIKRGPIASRPSEGEYNDAFYYAIDQLTLWRWDDADGEWVAAWGLGSSDDPIPASLYIEGLRPSERQGLPQYSNVEDAPQEAPSLIEVPPESVTTPAGIYRYAEDAGEYKLLDESDGFVSSGDLSDLNIDASRDWAEFDITNLGRVTLRQLVAATTDPIDFDGSDLSGIAEALMDDASVSNAPSAATDVVRKTETDVIESDVSDLETDKADNPHDNTQHLEDYIPDTEKGAASGVAELDDNSVVRSSQVPDLAVTETYTVADEAERLALDVEEGDLAIQQDEEQAYIFTGGDPTSDSDWSAIVSPPAPLDDWNGRTGSVDPESGDYSYGQISGTHGNEDHDADYKEDSAVQSTSTANGYELTIDGHTYEFIE